MQMTQAKVDKIDQSFRKTTNDQTDKKYDVFARFESSSTGGRGQDIGWARCPLCPTKSKKRYAFGRGISSHLHAVHTPWNLSKQEIRNREKQLKNQEWMKKLAESGVEGLKNNGTYFHQEENSVLKYCTWDPTPEEVTQWGIKVLELTALVESSEYNYENNLVDEDKSKCLEMKTVLQPGYDRTGKKATSYRDSLSPFHNAAANGNIEELKNIIKSSKTELMAVIEKENNIKSILYSRDRNGAIAEHWAAGGGHIDCLEYLLSLKKQHSFNNNKNNKTNHINPDSKTKRRDGKTSLHYAARNGHIDCIELLLQQPECFKVDEPSGDGTTPLHMACYGGKFHAIKFLIEEHKAKPSLENDWGCNASHWIAMTINDNTNEVIQACDYLYNECQLSFHTKQKQGHTPLHKAAQRKNVHVIQWIARSLKNGFENEEIGLEDVGGNKPSDILESVGGDAEVVQWMRLDFGW